MLKTYMELPGGQVLSSGNAGEDAILSVTYTQSVNSGEELTAGAVCAGELEVKFLGDVPISAGDRLKVWRQDELGNRYQLGIFIPEKPTREGAHYLKLIAYDPVVLLDRDVTALLKELPTTSLQVLAEQVCAFCGLTLTGDALPLGELAVSALSGEGITGRQVLGWIGGLTGQFCRANTDGSVSFCWYAENNRVKLGAASAGGISVEGGALTGLSGSYQEGILTLLCEATMPQEGALQLEVTDGGKTVGYYSGSLSFEEYTVKPIEKVQLRKTADDVGTVYPDGLEGTVNTYVVEGNPLLGAVEEAALPLVAEHLYHRMAGISYTPCKVSISAGFDIVPGDVVELTDKKGKTLTAYIMTKTQQGQKDTLECTGSPARESTTAVNNRSNADMAGKVMNLRTDINGLMAEHHNSADKLTRLELDMDGLRSRVSQQEALGEQFSAVKQTAEEITISLEKLRSDGAEKLKTAMGYTFDDAGLHIERSGAEVGSHLNETGLHVLRNAGTGSETVMLKADAQGVIATDVKVRNYLIIGSYARLEDYGENRTACFYLGGS